MYLSKSKIFLIFCVAFIVGVGLGRFVDIPIMALAAMVFVVIGTIGWNNRNAKIIAFAGLILLLGSLRMYFYGADTDIPQYFGKTLDITGTIVEEPDVRLDKTYLTVGDIEIDDTEIKGQMLLSIGQTTEYHYGQRPTFSGKVSKPKDAAAAGEFSYKNYLSRFGVFAVVYYPRVEEVADGFGNPVKHTLLAIKQKFVSTLALLLPEPQNSFLAALLVGLRRSIPQHLTDAFNITGTTHIIAISGFNISIIVWFLNKLLSRFGRKISFLLSLIFILGFVILAGASASVVRAGIMGCLLLVALNIGRLSEITNALVLTATIMLAINPSILAFDVGFQLSFLALMGIIYLSPILEPQFALGPKPVKNFLRKYLVPTLAAQIFTFPVLLYYFDRISLIAPLSNVLVLVFVPATMLFGFLAGLAGLIWLPLAIPFAAVAWLLLTYIIKVVEWTAQVPLASVQYENFSVWLLILYYLVLIGVLTKSHWLWRLRPRTL